MFQLEFIDVHTDMSFNLLGYLLKDVLALRCTQRQERALWIIDSLVSRKVGFTEKSTVTDYCWDQ